MHGMHEGVHPKRRSKGGFLMPNFEDGVKRFVEGIMECFDTGELDKEEIAV